jgi:hypothetical protein
MKAAIFQDVTAVESDTKLSTILRNLLPPSSGQNVSSHTLTLYGESLLYLVSL